MPSQKQATTHPLSTPSNRSSSRSTSGPGSDSGRPRRVPFRRKPYQPGENAFSADCLDRARRRAAEPGLGERLDGSPHARRSQWTGPWDVEPVPAGNGVIHAVCRREEPVSEGGGARLAFLHRQEGLFATAALTAVATPNRLSVNTEKPSGRRSRLGHPIHDGARHLGHIVRGEPEELSDFLASFHAVRCLAADPDAAVRAVTLIDGTVFMVIDGKWGSGAGCAQAA